MDKYKLLTRELVNKLDHLPYDSILPEKIHLVLIGSYAKEHYGIPLGRKTEDIDFYCPCAPEISIAKPGEFSSSPAATGISTQLSDSRAELFTSLTNSALDELILAYCTEENKLKFGTKRVAVYVVPPELFVLTKIISHNSGRNKDLTDIREVMKKFPALKDKVIALSLALGVTDKAERLLPQCSIDDFI